MTTKYLNPTALNNGLSWVKSSTHEMLVCKNVQLGDTYATLKGATRLIGAASGTTVENAIGASTQVGNTYQIQTSVVSITATAAALASDDLAVVLTDGANIVVLVTEAPNMAIAIDNIMDVQGFLITYNQPV